MKFRKTIIRQLLDLILPIGLMQFHVDEPGDGGDGGDEGGEAVGTGNQDRIDQLNRIADQNDRERADELALVNDDGSTEQFVAPPADEEGGTGEDDTPPQEAATGDENPDAPAPDTPTLPKIKVNGEEVELTPELIAKAQKIASADKYLEAAKHPPAAAPAPAAPAPSPAPSPDVQTNSVEEDRALVRAIQMGTEEEALAALQKLRQSQSALTPEIIGRIADERLNFKSAIDWFETEFKDLVADEQLHNIVMARDADLVRNGDKRSYKERYQAIGEEVRAWVKSLKGDAAPAPTAAPAPAPATSQTRVDRKAQAPKVPTAANAKSKPPAPEEDAEESPSAVIANIAKSRGGPQWLRG